MIKIIEVKKKHPPFKMNNGGTLYAYGCTVEDNGKQHYAKVVTFTESIEIVAGKEIEPSKTEQKSYTDQSTGEQRNYTQYTLYAPKKSFNRGSFKEKYTLEEFETVFDRALEYSKEKKLSVELTQSYIKYAFEHGLKIEKPAEIVIKTVNNMNNELPPEPAEDDPLFDN